MVDEWYGQTVIHSDKRFSYQDAQAILDAGAGEYHTELRTMMDLAASCAKNATPLERLCLNSQKVKFELDERGAPIKAYKKTASKL